jgi:hypothetical protein
LQILNVQLLRGIYKSERLTAEIEIESTNLCGTFTTETTSELEILGLDGDALGVDGSQVGIFEEGDEVSLCSFLESHDGRRLEAEIRLVVYQDISK